MELNGNLRIAVQRSGRLSEGSLELLRNMSLQFEAYQHRLFARCRNVPVDILFIRDDDIPEYVQDGIADLGIVGKNVLDEQKAKVNRLQKLDFGYCNLSVAVPEQQNYQSLNDLAGKRIATSHPITLRRYLKKRQIKAEIVALEGCVEIAPALKVSDAICDLVSTGSTLRTNRLKAIETISQSQAVLIGTTKPAGKKRDLIQKLLLRAQGVQEAKRFRYIMFNLPQDKLNAAKELVPGCDSPTVMPLANSGMIAVHSLVLEEQFWDVVEKIKEIGGSAILVSPIEKFVR